MAIIFICTILLIFTGCGSVNHAAPLNVPESAIEMAIQAANDDPIFQNGPVPQEWWLLFEDLQLTQFIHKALARNPSIQSAHAQILAAVYSANHVRSALYPYISWGADMSRQKLSETGVIPFATGPAGTGTPTINVPAMPGSSSGIPAYFTLYETELNLKFEFDFWNKNRNTLRAALGQVQANIAEEAFARLQLGIAVAKVYYELQIDYKRREIASAIVDNRSRYLAMVQRRLKANIENELSLTTAESNLSDVKELLLQIQGDIAVKEYQLKAFMAESFEEEIMPISVERHPLPKVPLPEDLPLHLIAQRPDITAQLWLIESAGRQIAVAKAGFYPDFNLAAFFGFQTIHFSQLFKWPSSFFNVDPAVSLPIFDGGRLVADLRASEINYDLAILEYNNLVINAAKEVLEAIAVFRNAWHQLEEIERKFERQREFNRLTGLRVSHSLSSSLDYLISEGNMLMAQDQDLIALGNTIQAILELIKALGGGYTSCNVEG